MEHITKFTPAEVELILLDWCSQHGQKLTEQSKVEFEVKEVHKGDNYQGYKELVFVGAKLTTRTDVQ